MSVLVEKSVLQQIREKELKISIKIDETRQESEQIILNARKAASEILENSDRDGKKAASDYYDKEMEKIRHEIEQLRDQGIQQATSVREAGERNLPSAIKTIVKKVTME